MANIRVRFIQNSPWRAILLAVVLLVLGELLLAWQYRQLEEGRLAELEQRVEEQAQTIEERAAQDALRDFMDARVSTNEQRALRYVTEEAALQRQQGVFEFFGVEDYSIQDKIKLDEGVFQFQVEITRDRLKQIELVEMKKISGEYYINSVQLAG